MLCFNTFFASAAPCSVRRRGSLFCKPNIPQWRLWRPITFCMVWHFHSSNCPLVHPGSPTQASRKTVQCKNRALYLSNPLFSVIQSERQTGRASEKRVMRSWTRSENVVRQGLQFLKWVLTITVTYCSVCDHFEHTARQHYAIGKLNFSTFLSRVSHNGYVLRTVIEYFRGQSVWLAYFRLIPSLWGR